MFSILNKTEPFAFYYVEEEWTNGTYPWTQRLIGYDAGNKKKEVVLSVRSGSAEEKREIVAVAKAKSYLWCCYNCADQQVEIVKSDLYGKDAVIVAKTKLNGFVDKLWANDKNAYIMTGDAVYQVDSKGCIHEVLSETCTDYFCGRITESFFLLFDSYECDANVLVFDNDIHSYDEYVCDRKFTGNGTCSEQAWCAGVYEGKVSVIKGFGAERGEVSCQVLYVLDGTKKEWEEYLLWKEDCDSYRTEAQNSIFTYIQTGKNELFAQSGPVLTLFQEDCMGMFTYNVNEGRRREICVTEGWCNTEGTHIVSKVGRYVYTCVWCDQGDGYMMAEVNLDTGERKVIVKDEGEYLISTCVE